MMSRNFTYQAVPKSGPTSDFGGCDTMVRRWKNDCEQDRVAAFPGHFRVNFKGPSYAICDGRMHGYGWNLTF